MTSASCQFFRETLAVLYPYHQGLVRSSVSAAAGYWVYTPIWSVAALRFNLQVVDIGLTLTRICFHVLCFLLNFLNGLKKANPIVVGHILQGAKDIFMYSCTRSDAHCFPSVLDSVICHLCIKFRIFLYPAGVARRSYTSYGSVSLHCFSACYSQDPWIRAKNTP